MHRSQPAVRSAWALVGLLLANLALTACGPQNPTPMTTTVPAVGASPTQTAATGDLASATPQALPSATPKLPPTQTASPTTEVSPTVMVTNTPHPAGSGSGSVSEFPDPNEYAWVAVVSGLERITDMVDAGDGRMLVLEQPGRIRLIQDGQLIAQPFLDISARVGSQGNEQGLLGFALHPNYAENGLFFVNYTKTNGDTVISRFQASAERTSADPAGEKVLLTVDQPYANHNGGSMAFGPDGYLYLGLGDGGSGGDPLGNGQKLTTLLGKVLRLDVDQGDTYAIPPDNPFGDGQKGRAEIWAYGLRNPWRFSFDRATGELYIGDVGQNQWEEIDYLPAGSAGGQNFGWNYREGANPYQGEPPAGLVLVEPVAQYKHPEGCSVTGGFVYRGSELPEFSGIYLYGDYCTGRVWGLLRLADGSWKNQVLFDSGAFVTSFGEDRSGELYLLDQRAGAVLKLVKRGE